MILADCFPPKERAVVDLGGPKMSVTNVAEYYYQHDKEFWTMADFKLPVPPFEKMWVEYRYPRSIRSKEMGVTSVRTYEGGLIPYVGCFVGAVNFEAETGRWVVFPAGSDMRDVEPYIRGKAKPNGWLLRGSMYFVDGRTDRVVSVGEMADMCYKVGEDGNISEFSFSNSMGKDEDERATRAYLLHPILLAFSFRNCKNIEVVDVEAPRALQRARIRRGKEPLIRYSVINVLPLATLKSPRSRAVVSDGTGVALHIRAGSFAHYGEKFGRKKLFGKYEGMYWRPQSVVGSAERGVSVHDYAVKKVED